jgi:hypothetical protein
MVNVFESPERSIASQRSNTRFCIAGFQVFRPSLRLQIPLGRCLLFILLLLGGDAHAHFTAKGHMHTLSEKKQVFANPDCRSTGTCDLKRFTLTTTAYEVWFSDDPEHPTYGNGAIVEYETDAVDAIERYAVVQFKRGCVFYSSKDGNGKVKKTVRDLVPSFGGSVPFCFHDWVIDSQDTDPAYNSDPEYGRFYLLRWNKPGSYEQRTQKFYGAEKPKRPAVYMVDYPAGAFVAGTGVRNVALAFNTCIYRSRDVPAETQRNSVNFAQPLHCFQWDNIYVYNFAAAKFQGLWSDGPDISKQKAPDVRAPAHLLALLIALIAVVVLLVSLRLSKSARG